MSTKPPTIVVTARNEEPTDINQEKNWGIIKVFGEGKEAEIETPLSTEKTPKGEKLGKDQIEKICEDSIKNLKEKTRWDDPETKIKLINVKNIIIERHRNEGGPRIKTDSIETEYTTKNITDSLLALLPK